MPTSSFHTPTERQSKINVYYENQAKMTQSMDYLSTGNMEKIFLIAVSVTVAVSYFLTRIR